MDKNTKFWPNSPYIFVQRIPATADLQISITFSLGKISSFCKKWQFNNKKYVHMNKTCQNEPGPPSRLNKEFLIFEDQPLNNFPIEKYGRNPVF